MARTLQFPDAIAEIGGTLRPRMRLSPYFFIIGAGVSSPQAPLAAEMIKDFKQGAARAPALGTASLLEDYSSWFEAAFPNRRDRQEYLRAKIEGKPISHANFRLAHLLSVFPAIKLVVTPNFDDFLERGLQLFGTPHRLLDGPVQINERTNLSDDPRVIQVLHVHGTYQHYDTANLTGEIRTVRRGRGNRSIKDVLKDIMRNRSPLVIGYAGWDGDVIMSAFKEQLSHAPPYNTYWFCHKRCNISELPPWFQSSNNVVLVVPQDGKDCLPATEVFAALLDAASLEGHMFARDPLGFFLKRLRESLPPVSHGDASTDPVDADLYLFSNRLLGFYANRHVLARDYDPVRIMARAASDMDIMAAGRTLIGWYAFHHEMTFFAEKKGLRFKFLLSDEACDKYLPSQQVSEVQAVRERVMRGFGKLAEKYPEYFQVKVISQQILDGISFAKIHMETTTETHDSRVVALFDINAAAGTDKPTLLFGCTCQDTSASGRSACTVHGLLDRTNVLFDRGVAICHRESSRMDDLVEEYDEGLHLRNNRPTQYRSRMPRIFANLANPSSEVSPPTCIQVHIASRCNSQCEMCDHWKLPNPGELSIEEWSRFFRGLPTVANGGGEKPARSQQGGFALQEGRPEAVRTVVFSGGEPLANRNIADILKVAHQSGLAVGLLTSGIISGAADHEGVNDHMAKVLKAIKRHVSWVSISIDGTGDVERRIRRPIPDVSRARMLKDFCTALTDADGESLPSLSATVTLQSGNIDHDFAELCRYIHGFGIRQVNFKFATGSRKSLCNTPNFLIEPTRLERFLEEWLLASGLPQQEGNNLRYIRRCLVSGDFQINDISAGMPLASFYRSGRFRCFTPYLFAMIDSGGGVYPCCHLYRDNHGADPKSTSYRQMHCVGNLRDVDLDLMRIWQSQKYADKRTTLQRVNPEDGAFYPCGECTRHYVHNRALTDLHKCYADNPDRFMEWANRGDFNPTVWF